MTSGSNPAISIWYISSNQTGLVSKALEIIVSLLTGVPILPAEEAILEIAEEILRKAILPRSASVDALHIAMVAHHHVNYVIDVELHAYRECTNSAQGF